MHLICIKRKPNYKTFCAFDNMLIEDDEIWYDTDQRKVFHKGCPPIEIKNDNVATAQSTQTQTSRPLIQHQKVKTLDVKSRLLPQIADLFDGKFCVPVTFSDGSHSHAVVWLKTMGERTKYPGSKRIRVHLGRHNNVEFIDAAFITAKGCFVWRKDFAHAELTDEKRKAAIAAIELVCNGKSNSAFAVEYAKLARKCWHCNRDLTSEVTLKNIEETGGLGPYCFKHYPHLAKQVLEQKTENKTPIVSFEI